LKEEADRCIVAIIAGVLALSATLAKYFKTGVFDGGGRRGSAIASAVISGGKERRSAAL
jgi:hypothetical protein